MQSFLGSLNYYSQFIEDYAIYASVLYELRELEFVAMSKEATQARIQQVLEVDDADQGSQRDRGGNHRKALDLEAPDPIEVDPLVVYASDWAISGALMQEYDRIYYPVTFASCTLKSNELNYHLLIISLADRTRLSAW
ncbi:reverse transcriptase [Phytophthora megakarya]|uniref:Reverse transcriptase n=1 Tax=Phytophthora megakarya TaxID=4795 RepID=A0A225UKA7_9STRA|nr:reverse transcriptase [Phytophthora megakarya]